MFYTISPAGGAACIDEPIVVGSPCGRQALVHGGEDWHTTDKVEVKQTERHMKNRQNQMPAVCNERAAVISAARRGVRRGSTSRRLACLARNVGGKRCVFTNIHALLRKEICSLR